MELEISKCLKTNDFNSALLHLEKRKPTTIEAIRILWVIFKSCETEYSKSISNELTTLIQTTFTYVNLPTDNEIKAYLSCSYRLLRYFIDKDDINIYELREAWCPSFITSNNLNQHLESYTSQCVLICNYVIKVIKSNQEEIESIIDLLIEMVSKVSLVILSEKGLFPVISNLLMYVSNDKAFENLSRYLLKRCLEENDVNKLLDVIYNIFSTEPIKMEIIKNVFFHFDDTCDLIVKFKVITRDGISLQCLNLINKVIEELKVEDEELYSKILWVLFRHFFFIERNNLHKDSNTLKYHLELLKIIEWLENKITSKYEFTIQNIICESFQRCVLNINEIPNMLFKKMLIAYNKGFYSIYKLSKDCWEKNVIPFLSTLSKTAHLMIRNKKNNNYIITLYEMIIKEYLIACEFLNLKDCYEECFIHKSLCSLSKIYSSEDTKKSMVTIGLNIFRCKKDIKSCSCAGYWIQAKTSNKRDSNVKKITIASLLKDPELQSLIKLFKTTFTKEDLSYILLKEIKIYCAFYQSKIPLSECCMQIYNLNDDDVMINALVLSWFKMPDLILPEMYPIINEITKRIDGKLPMSNEDKILASKLYFLAYHVNIKIISEEIKKEISSTPVEQEDTKAYRYGLNIPNDKWDCMINDQLKIEQLIEMKKPLVKSRDILKGIFNSIDLENENLLQEYNLFKFIKELATVFLLHADRIEYIKTLVFLKKIAEMTNSINWRIKSIGSIIAEVNIPIEDLVKEAEDLLNQADTNVIIEFYINVSMSYYNKGLVNEAINYYVKAKNSIGEDLNVIDKNLAAEFEFLEWHLFGLPCQEDIGKERFIHRSVTLFNRVEGAIKEQSNSISYIHLLQIRFTFKVQVCYNDYMKWPREARGSSKTMVQLCQKYILPLQYAEVLIYLANMDLQCEKLSDCRAKINALSRLLGISRNDDKDIEKNVDILTAQINEITLDSKIPNLAYNKNSGSPTLSIDKWEYPHFLSHDIKCECFYCMSLEYQKLVLMYFLLKGCSWALHGEIYTAESFYKMCLKIYDSIISKNTEYINKLNNLFNFECSLDLKEIFCEYYVSILYNQAKLFVGTKKYNKISDELMSLTQNIRYKNPTLYNDIYCLELTHLHLNLDIEEIQSPTTLSPVLTESNVIVTTPENQVSQIRVTPTQSPTSIRKRIIKSIKFDWSDGENTPSTSTTSTNLTNTVSKLKTTTKPSGIKVYQPRNTGIKNKGEKSVKKTTKRSTPKVLITAASEDKESPERNKNELDLIPKVKSESVPKKTTKKMRIKDFVISPSSQSENESSKESSLRKLLKEKMGEINDVKKMNKKLVEDSSSQNDSESSKENNSGSVLKSKKGDKGGDKKTNKNLVTEGRVLRQSARTKRN